jgi:hypothetical protein
MALGAISTRKIAMPKLKGTPMRRARPDVTSVPIKYGRAPYTSLPSTGFQAVPKKNFRPNLPTTGPAPVISVYEVISRIIIAEAATAATMISNRLSAVSFIFL